MAPEWREIGVRSPRLPLVIPRSDLRRHQEESVPGSSPVVAMAHRGTSVQRAPGAEHREPRPGWTPVVAMAMTQLH